MGAPVSLSECCSRAFQTIHGFSMHALSRRFTRCGCSVFFRCRRTRAGEGCVNVKQAKCYSFAQKGLQYTAREAPLFESMHREMPCSWAPCVDLCLRARRVHQFACVWRGTCRIIWRATECSCYAIAAN